MMTPEQYRHQVGAYLRLIHQHIEAAEPDAALLAWKQLFEFVYRHGPAALAGVERKPVDPAISRNVAEVLRLIEREIGPVQSTH